MKNESKDNDGVVQDNFRLLSSPVSPFLKNILKREKLVSITSMNNLFQKYNNKNTILVVSSYPDKKNGIKDLNAVAWYAQKTIKSLPADGQYRFIFLSEIINKPQIYEDGDFLVVRCWKRNSPFLFTKLLSEISKFDQTGGLLVEFEFNTFGGLINTALFPIFLSALKLMGKKVILELHQVILDINSLSGHLNLKSGGFVSFVFNLALQIFYRSICFLSNRIIVLEEELKQRLLAFTGEEKVTSLFIAISSKNQLNKDEARQKLNIGKDELVLLCFGFITWYKGADWLVKESFNKNFKLILAGGESPTLKGKAHYKKFYKNILADVKNSANIQITGFVDEEDISTYFSAADLVVLPYRAFMSASGPLSLALSFKKPFIFSSKLSDYFKSDDFQESLKKSHAARGDILFSFNRPFEEKLKTIDLNRLQQFSNNLSQMRSAENLGRIYMKALQNDLYPTACSYNLGFVWDKLRPILLAFRLG